MSPRDPVADLRRIAFLLERTLESPYRIKAFRTAAAALEAIPADDVRLLVSSGELRGVKGLGERTVAVVEQAVAGAVPEYLAGLEADAATPLVEGGTGLRALLRGDLHSHSDWSDGGSPILEMACTARDLGHEYLALTDHSPRLKVARGLTAERLRAQLDALAELRPTLTETRNQQGDREFRLLSGIEVDILDDGTLDQDPDLLAELDLVVASVHSKLTMPAAAMTARMIAAVTDPRTTVLGHCTGRYVAGRVFASGGKAKERPPSAFDADAVFAACAERGVAVEINARPERLDPPIALLRKAVEAGCLVSIDTDAHAPGQLDWQVLGCARAELAGVPASRVINTWSADDLLTWTRDRSHRPTTQNPATQDPATQNPTDRTDPTAG